MKNNKRRHLPVLSFLAVVIVLILVLHACASSKNQDTQIINVFTPGSIEAGANMTQTPGSATNPAESAHPAAEVTQPPAALPTMIVTDTHGQPLIVTQTLAAIQPVGTPTSAAYPINTTVPTQPNQPTITRTATTTPSPVPPTGWAGEWTAYLAQADGSFLVGALTISLDGEVLRAEFDAQGSRLSLVGILQEQGASASGDYSGFSGVGYFHLVIEPVGAFVGNLDNELAFCASRQGFAQPEPCGFFFPR
ncbi:MAG: hypothetical protein GX603_04900 [Chloroflexi bacterium]|nr:hypothetical protein [Chloroflexota bacterium]